MEVRALVEFLLVGYVPDFLQHKLWPIYVSRVQSSQYLPRKRDLCNQCEVKHRPKLLRHLERN